MPNTLKTLLLIPLALLASCATGPKLTPEMEALRLSLNQRMANTSSTLKSASVSKLPDGRIHESLKIDTNTYKTTIQPNCNVQIDKTFTTREDSFLEGTGQGNQFPTSIDNGFINLKLDAALLRTTTVRLSDEKKWLSQAKISGSISTDDLGSASRDLFRNYECYLILTKGKFAITQKSSNSASPYGAATIATSPDKAFIQGIVRDMNRFIELYKALPK